MGEMGRPGLSAAQKAELWQRWKQGPSLSEIGRALGKHAGSIHGVLSSNGGFIPPVRRRSRWALTLAEREEISRGIANVNCQNVLLWKCLLDGGAYDALLGVLTYQQYSLEKTLLQSQIDLLV
jgi:hypothetical protein